MELSATWMLIVTTPSFNKLWALAWLALYLTEILWGFWS